MSLLVKLCGLRTQAEVDSAVAAGADAVGFVLTPSPRMVDVEQAARLAAALPDGVLSVAVFHQPDAELVAETERLMAPDLYQAEPEYLGGVDPRRVLPVVVDGPDLDHRIDLASSRFRGLVLVDSAARGGTGRGPDWDRVAASRHRARVVLAGGLHPDNVAGIVRRVRPRGVDVSSGIEAGPGVKDPRLMRRFVAAARVGSERGEAAG